MMKKFILLTVNFLTVGSFVFAQSNPPATTKKPVEPIYSIFQSAEQDKLKREDSLGKAQKECAPPMPKVKSDDVIFAKRITRDIYFADPANRFLVPSVMDRNIIDILKKGVESGDIAAYQSYDASNNKLTDPIDMTTGPDALKTILDAKVGIFTPVQYGEMDNGLGKMALRIIEDWYFDTNRSEFKSFIFAIGLEYAGADILSTLSNSDANKDLKNPSVKIKEVGKSMAPLFWVNYPTIRDYLCKFRIYNQNERIRYTFDDVFQLRYFSSLIIEESNVSGTKITDMKAINGEELSGLDKLLEADRIKKGLIQFEQDMWEQ